MNRTQLLPRLKKAFALEPVFCRLFAAWVTFAFVKALGYADFSRLAAGQDLSLSVIAVWTVLLFAGYSLVAFLLNGLPSDSWFLFLSSALLASFWLARYGIYSSGYFFLPVALLMLVVVLYTLRVNLAFWERWHPESRTVAVCAVLAGVMSFTVLVLIGVFRYLTFSAPNFDFGIFCNMFYNMKETGLPFVTCERDELLSHFAVHLSPIYYLILPFYFVFPSPVTLQVAQSLILAAGVLPVALLGKELGLSPKTRMASVILYAFYPLLSTGTFYDLHENCFLPFFLLMTFYCFEKKQWIPMYVSAICVLAVKEDAAVYLVVFALYLLLSRRKPLHGLLLLALSVGYFFLAVYLINTYGTGVMTDSRYGNLIYDAKDGFWGIVKTALVNPGYLLVQSIKNRDGLTLDKVFYLIELFFPLGLLPFCTNKPSRWLLLTPVLLNVLTTYPYQYQNGFQYHFGITAFLFYAMMLNLGDLALPTRRTVLAVALTACLCLYLCLVPQRADHYVSDWRQNRARYERIEEILDTVPADASVITSSFLLPHLANRATVYEVAYHDDEVRADYVVLNASDESYVRRYRAQGYAVEQEDDLIVILKDVQ